MSAGPRSRRPWIPQLRERWLGRGLHAPFAGAFLPTSSQMRTKASCSAVDQNGQQDPDENTDKRGCPVWGKGAEGHGGTLAASYGRASF